jgi:hypothetical protein
MFQHPVDRTATARQLRRAARFIAAGFSAAELALVVCLGACEPRRPVSIVQKPRLSQGISVVGQGTGGPAAGQCPSGMPGPGQGPDPIPAPAATLGYTCEVFDANFTSLSAKDGVNGHTLVDANNTLQPGYDLYIDGNWPYSADPVWRSGQVIMPASYYSITTAQGCGTGADNATLGLCLNPLGYHTIMSSCGPKQTFAGWTGNIFTWGYYMDATGSWADNGESMDPAYPSIFTLPLELWLADLSTSPFYKDGANDHFSEKDLLDERFTGGTIDWIFDPNTGDIISEYGSAMTANVGPTYGMLVLPQGKSVNGEAGYGSIGFYANDVIGATSPLLFKPGELPQPDTSSDGAVPPAGTWSTEDTDHDCLIVYGGPGAPLFLTSVKVWEAPR